MRLGTWVWTFEDVVQPQRRQELIRFARRHRLGVLFVHLSAEFEHGAGWVALLDLLERARLGSIDVMWVAGDPHWCLPERHSTAVATIERSSRINQLLRARGVKPVAGIAFDIEPYALPEWKRHPNQLTQHYLALLDVILARSRQTEVQAVHTIPFWFSTRVFDGRSLDVQVMSRSDAVIVMAYRNSPSKVLSIAASSLHHGARGGRPVAVAVETKCGEPRHTTFCGLSPAELAAALWELERSLQSFPAFAGLLVHHYGSWHAQTRRFNFGETP